MRGFRIGCCCCSESKKFNAFKKWWTFEKTKWCWETETNGANSVPRIVTTLHPVNVTKEGNTSVYENENIQKIISQCLKRQKMKFDEVYHKFVYNTQSQMSVGIQYQMFQFGTFGRHEERVEIQWDTTICYCLHSSKKKEKIDQFISTNELNWVVMSDLWREMNEQSRGIRD